jgi:Carbohydrate-binding module 48 (Isoamylase N-terminal domain)
VLFDSAGASTHADIPLTREGDVWSVYVEGLPKKNVLYGYRVDGEGGWDTGHRWDASRVLLDPYAKHVAGRAVFGVRDEFEKFEYKVWVLHAWAVAPKSGRQSLRRPPWMASRRSRPVPGFGLQEQPAGVRSSSGLPRNASRQTEHALHQLAVILICQEGNHDGLVRARVRLPFAAWQPVLRDL